MVWFAITMLLLANVGTLVAVHYLLRTVMLHQEMIDDLQNR